MLPSMLAFAARGTRRQLLLTAGAKPAGWRRSDDTRASWCSIWSVMFRRIHQCRPEQPLVVGQKWECPECGQPWTARMWWQRVGLVDVDGEAVPEGSSTLLFGSTEVVYPDHLLPGEG